MAGQDFAELGLNSFPEFYRGRHADFAGFSVKEKIMETNGEGKAATGCNFVRSTETWAPVQVSPKYIYHMRIRFFTRRSLLIFLSLPVLLMLTACSKIERNQLFEMVYPPLDFEFPAGLPPNSLWVQDYPGLPSPFESLANQAGVDTARVAGVFPLRASLISLDGTRLDFFRSIQVLVCIPGTGECSLLGDEVFYNDQLNDREDVVIDLQPGLRNVKEEFANEVVRIQLIFGLSRPSPLNVDCRFQMSFEAVD